MERMEVDQCAGASSGGGALRRSNSAPMISGVSSDAMTVFSSVSSARYRRSSMSVNPSCPGLVSWSVCAYARVPPGLSHGGNQLKIFPFVNTKPPGDRQPIDCLVVLGPPLSPFSLVSERSDHQRQEESMELNMRGNFLRESASSLVPLPPVSPWHDHISLGVHSLDSGVTPNSSPSPTRRYRNRAAVSAAVRLPSLTPLKRKGGVESDAPPKKLFVAGVTDPPHLTGYTVSVSQASSSPPGGFRMCHSTRQPPVTFPPPFTSHHHPSI